MTSVPSTARAVIIGGGIIGCSTAYHLAKLGWRDVVLLERHKLTSGSTWHAAGLVGQLRTSANITQLLKYSVELYARLETGDRPGHRLEDERRPASRLQRRAADGDQAPGDDGAQLRPRDAPADADGGAEAVAGDGGRRRRRRRVPADRRPGQSRRHRAGAGQGRARRPACAIVEDCRVTAIESRTGRAVGVVTAAGDIAAEVVVNCAGQWAREVGQLAGVSVPLQSVQHQYLVTEPIDGVPRNLPTLRDPDRLIYFKEEVGGLVMGGYEPNPIAWALDGIPDGFHFTLLDSNWDHFEPMMERRSAACRRCRPPASSS